MSAAKSVPSRLNSPAGFRIRRRARTLVPVLLAVACAGRAAAVFGAQWTGDLKLVSDSVFRGIDRTDGPALQGEVDLIADNGAYAGAWASNAEAAGGSEVDPYAGYGRTVTIRQIYPVHLDMGVIGYLFPGDERDADGRRNLDFAEAYGGFRMGPVSFKAYLAPDYANAGGPGAAFRGTLRWPLWKQLELRLEGGANFGPELRDYTARITRDGRGRDYFDYAAMLGYPLPSGFRFAAGVAGTTLDIADGQGRDGAQPRVLLQIGKHFDF